MIVYRVFRDVKGIRQWWNDERSEWGEHATTVDTDGHAIAMRRRAGLASFREAVQTHRSTTVGARILEIHVS